MTDAVEREWLEADGLGGFAMGTVRLLRTRRYHALLQTATTPPTGRVVLVAGLDLWFESEDGLIGLWPHEYADGTRHPLPLATEPTFTAVPWPTWIFSLPHDRSLRMELLVPRDKAAVILRWRLDGGRPSDALYVRPLLAGRDHHALSRETAAAPHARHDGPSRLRFSTSTATPDVLAAAAGAFRAEPLWYRSFQLAEEHARGFDAVEDLHSPGLFEFAIAHDPAILILAADIRRDVGGLDWDDDPATTASRLITAEERRRSSIATIDLAADSYLVRRGGGLTIIAGYPWFTDWGRDTFIALRGLLLARGRLDDALACLSAWAPLIRDGLVPNRLPDVGVEPEYNSVDASLWFVLAVRETLELIERSGRPFDVEAARAARSGAANVLRAFITGTRWDIGLGRDALLRAGTSGTQLTWMDARVDGRAVTPRVGKPVEIQALWLNALHASRFEMPELLPLIDRGLAAFARRFVDPIGGGLFDVVDVDGVEGSVDPTLRPNQILAAGGLPLALVDDDRCRAIVDRVERALLVPLGLRSLDPADRRYYGRHEGGPERRDRSYHQGTAWAWLLGPFVDAWWRTRRDGERDLDVVRRRFLEPLRRHAATEAGIGHVSEIADGDAPHRPRGAPFQAWSLAEWMRLETRFGS